MTSIAEAFYDLKHVLLGFVPLGADAMHVHIGLLLFLLVAAVVRGERRFTIAFLVVLAVCLVGEALDLIYDLLAGRRLRWRNGVKDIIDTTLWPGVWALCWSRIGARRAAAPRTGAAPEATMPATAPPAALPASELPGTREATEAASAQAT